MRLIMPALLAILIDSIFRDGWETGDKPVWSSSS